MRFASAMLLAAAIATSYALPVADGESGRYTRSMSSTTWKEEASSEHTTSATIKVGKAEVHADMSAWKREDLAEDVDNLMGPTDSEKPSKFHSDAYAWRRDIGGEEEFSVALKREDAETPVSAGVVDQMLGEHTMTTSKREAAKSCAKFCAWKRVMVDELDAAVTAVKFAVWKS